LRVVALVKRARVFEVFGEIIDSGLEGSIHTHWADAEPMDFVISVSLVDRTQEQLAALAAIVERYDLALDVDDHRLATLR
jgi:hypothetical protein